MFLSYSDLRVLLSKNIESKRTQGYDLSGLAERPDMLPESYDAYMKYAKALQDAPLRSDWQYIEPLGWDAVIAEWAHTVPRSPIAVISADDAAERVETAFYAAVAGCILGKPLECDPTLEEIKAAATLSGEWPLRTYVSMDLLKELGRHGGSPEATTSGNISYVTPDDDINYLILALILLENHGAFFTRDDILTLWMRNLPVLTTYGPERTLMAKAAAYCLLHETAEGIREAPIAEWRMLLNPEDEMCGAAIRVDTYGYAFPGDPYRAVECAWRDASCTHARTGVYGSLFIAAAVATAFVADSPMDIFETALKFVPQNSRFFSVVNDCFELVAKADEWEKGYAAIHAKYKKYGHCKLYQECGQLINTAKFAKDTNDAICIQVMQGCDTDCFGKIAGSIMGAYFGKGSLDEEWISPFNDRLHTHLADFHEQSLCAVAERMKKLPVLLEPYRTSGV
jgi:ADP-ribosylglycohydrolase